MKMSVLLLLFFLLPSFIHSLSIFLTFAPISMCFFLRLLSDIHSVPAKHQPNPESQAVMAVVSSSMYWKFLIHLQDRCQLWVLRFPVQSCFFFLVPFLSHHLEASTLHLSVWSIVMNTNHFSLYSFADVLCLSKEILNLNCIILHWPWPRLLSTFVMFSRCFFLSMSSLVFSTSKSVGTWQLAVCGDYLPMCSYNFSHCIIPYLLSLLITKTMFIWWFFNYVHIQVQRVQQFCSISVMFINLQSSIPTDNRELSCILFQLISNFCLQCLNGQNHRNTLRFISINCLFRIGDWLWPNSSKFIPRCIEGPPPSFRAMSALEKWSCLLH